MMFFGRSEPTRLFDMTGVRSGSQGTGLNEGSQGSGTDFDVLPPSPVTFTASGAYEEYVVPAGVTTVSVDAYGAQGGDYDSAAKPGGFGGRVACDVTVLPGETLRVYVGVKGALRTSNVLKPGGFPDGGGGLGGSGGGSTQVRRSPYALDNRLVVAPGGGGRGANGNPGVGGTPTGTDAAVVSSEFPAQGATASAGGAPGLGSSTAGSLGQGGQGGSFAGGGGGGRYGGGGGTTTWSGSGGGGSGLGTGVNQTVQNGIRSGDGTLEISPIVP